MGALYELLGVARGANAEDLRRAYRRLAREAHPDVTDEAGAEERFMQVSAAYGILSDPQKRARYDRLLPDRRQTGSRRPPARPVGARPQSASTADIDLEHLLDLDRLAGWWQRRTQADERGRFTSHRKE